MSAEQRLAAYVLVFAGLSFVGFFLAAAPGERSFTLLAREASFTPEAHGNQALPALREPGQLASFASSETRVFDGRPVPKGGGECRFGPAEVEQPESPPVPGVFLGVKLTQPTHCQLAMSWKSGPLGSELAFRASGKSDCTLAGEFAYADAVNAEPRAQPLPALAGWSASCGGAGLGVNLPDSIRTMRMMSSGWLTTRWRAPSFTVWDAPQLLSAIELVLSQATTLGEPGDSCRGEPGDRVRVRARRVVLGRVEARAEGLALPIQVSSDWQVEVGGCQAPKARRQFADALAAWFQFFVALGGMGLLTMTLREPPPACKRAEVGAASGAASPHESDAKA